jgi:hypothetical protein
MRQERRNSMEPPTGFSSPPRMKLGAPSIAPFAMGGKAQILQSFCFLLKLHSCFSLGCGFAGCGKSPFSTERLMFCNSARLQSCRNYNKLNAGFSPCGMISAILA